MQGDNLKQMVRNYGAKHCYKQLDDLLVRGRRGDKNGLRYDSLGLREIAEAFCGERWVNRLDPRTAQGFTPLYEGGGDAIDVSAFSNITGQIIFSKILDSWKITGIPIEQLVTIMPSKLAHERFPMLGNLKSDGEEIHPGMPYPRVGFGENYVDTPETTKRGMIVPVFKETVFFDRTNQILGQDGKVGEMLKKRRDKKILLAVMGQVPFSWNSSNYTTYQAGGTFWDNVVTGNPLVDYKSLEKSQIKFSEQVDPDTGEPIEIESNVILVPRSLLFTARRIVNATSVRSTYPGYATQGSAANVSIPAPGNVETESANPLDDYAIVTTPYLKSLQLSLGNAGTANSDWWTGDFKRAFVYVQNWDITVVQAPSNSEQDFDRDIIYQAKASERGAAGVMSPWYVQKNTA